MWANIGQVVPYLHGIISLMLLPHVFIENRESCTNVSALIGRVITTVNILMHSDWCFDHCVINYVDEKICIDM